MKVIDMKEVKLRSVNNKYNLNPKTKRLFLNPTYRKLKEELTAQVKDVEVEAPYKVLIVFDTYLDIDNPVKLILDSLGGIITNDRDILCLTVVKRPIIRGRPGRLKVYLETYGGDE